MSEKEVNFLPVGTLLHGNTYRIVRHIGSGGFGNTYEAEHIVFKVRRAIKEFFPKNFCQREADGCGISIISKSQTKLVEKLRRKFLDEARALYALNHPGIVHVHEVFEENGTAYFVMDYVGGESLEDKLGKYGALSEKETLVYIRQVTDALAHVHAQNRLHLDIKPNNIMVDEQGRAVLIDFGASKYYDENSGKNVSTVVGFTPGFAPSEQADNDIKNFSPATDIYALGATLYRLLTNITPPSAAAIATEEEELKPLPAHISAATRKAVTAAMQFARKKRPQSIAAFLKMLEEPPIVAEPPVPRASSQETQLIKPKEPKGHQSRSTFNKWLLAFIIVVVEAVVVIVNEMPYVWLIVVFVLAVIVLITFGRTSKPTYDPCEGDNLAIEKERNLSNDRNPDDNLSSKNNSHFETATPITSTVEPPITLPSEKPTGVYFDASSNAIVYGPHSYKMVYVSGGTFTMGATAEQGDDAYDWEKPAHQVTLSGYYMGRTEVPQWLWTAVMGSNPSNWKGDNLPVETVRWNYGQTFISRLNSLTGKSFRLPTEAQWEFAARGGNRSRGYKYSGSDNLGSVAWYRDNSGSRTHNVATKSPNELGLYDMSGNVWEWCSDWYDAYSDYAQTNPKGASSGSLRVLRGGSWNDNAWDCRVSDRISDTPSIRYGRLGLRLAL